MAPRFTYVCNQSEHEIVMCSCEWIQEKAEGILNMVVAPMGRIIRAPTVYFHSLDKKNHFFRKFFFPLCKHVHAVKA